MAEDRLALIRARTACQRRAVPDALTWKGRRSRTDGVMVYAEEGFADTDWLLSRVDELTERIRKLEAVAEAARDMRSRFRERTHPGYMALQSSNVPIEVVEGWDVALAALDATPEAARG